MARPLSKVLLLDMDGVVLHQPYLHRFVTMRVVSFVRRRLDPILKDITYEQAKQINQILYTSYGHTLLGMNRVFHTHASIQDFNKSVYDSTTLQYVQNFQDDRDMNKRANEIRQVLEHCYQAGIPVYVFSNAPLCWSQTILHTMGLAIPSDRILGSDHPVADRNGQLKPVPSLYHEVESLLTYRHGLACEIIFVDDSMMNLRPCMGMTRWKPILLHPNLPSMDVTPLFIRPSIPTTLELM